MVFNVDNSARPWTPYENSGIPGKFDRVRQNILSIALTKRRFALPRVNLVGLSFLELAVAVALFGALGGMGFAQRDLVKESGSFAQLWWVPLLAVVTFRVVAFSIFGTSRERCVFWHGYFALAACLYGAWHGFIALYRDTSKGDPPGLSAFSGSGKYDSRTYLTGSIAVACMALIIVTSIGPIRRAVRRWWMHSHHLLVVVAAVAATLHGAGGAVAAGFGIIIVDRLYGYWLACFKNNRGATTCRADILSDNLVRLTFPRSFNFLPGQYVRLYSSRIKWFEWHSFSIASAPQDDNLVIFCKPDGLWTRNLYQLIADAAPISTVESTIGELNIRLNGPLGSVGLAWQGDRYTDFLLICGGIGATPMISMYRHLAWQQLRGRNLGSVRLVWSSRSRQTVEALLQMENTDMAHSIEGPSPVNADDVRNLSAFVADVYLSSPEIQRDRCDDGLANRSTSRDRDATVRSTFTWHSGRPDLRKVFDQARSDAEFRGAKRVAVLACGPASLTSQVCTQASKASDSNVHMDVHLEHFY
jgi:NAD(P)H-flavin reductase